MFGNAWAGIAKYKNFSDEIPVTVLSFNLSSGNLIYSSYPDNSPLRGLSKKPEKYGTSNFKNLDYFKCDNGTKYYRQDVKKANVGYVKFYSRYDYDKERCGVSLSCNNGYYVDNETNTIADECIRQNTVSVVDKATNKPLNGVRFQGLANDTDSEGKTLSSCNRGKDDVCAELAGYEKKCQICKENMVFKLEKIVKKSKKTEKTKEKESAENPVAPPAETSGTTNADKDKANNPSGEDGGEDANETPVATENGNGTAAAGNGDASTESAGNESDENEQFSFAKLDKILDEYFSDSSNWKNEDGNFNTARLVSDSVAGVVLGTAGGVITSKIIKKNQIKKGFEDLKCTVGGQEVATYGDEFTVGAKQ